jgi:hypothetical protein
MSCAVFAQNSLISKDYVGLYVHARTRTHAHTQALDLKGSLVVMTAGSGLSWNSRDIPVLRSVLQSHLFQVKLYLLGITTSISVVISCWRTFPNSWRTCLVEHRSVCEGPWRIKLNELKKCLCKSQQEMSIVKFYSWNISDLTNKVGIISSPTPSKMLPSFLLSLLLWWPCSNMGVQYFWTRGHNRYCGLVRGPHVSKLQYVVPTTACNIV